MTSDASGPGRISFTRRHALIGGACLATSVAANARMPQPVYSIIPNKSFEGWMPDAFGRWSVKQSGGVLLPPPDALSDRLYDNLITRVFSQPFGPPVMLLIAYNNIQNGMLQVHRPEFCYPAGGYRLSETRPIEIPLEGGRAIPANGFTADGPDHTEQVVYFTRLGRHFPRTWVDQRIAVADANLRGEIPDGAMLRISAVDRDFAASVKLLGDFAREFLNAAPVPLRQMLLGRPASHSPVSSS